MIKNLRKNVRLLRSGKRNNRHLGDLDTRLLSFVTPAMITVLLIVIYIVSTSIDTLRQYYETNIVLNGLIIGTLIFTIGLVFSNLIDLYKAARFLKSIDETTADGDASDQDIDQFHAQLRTRGKILNISNMHDAIDRIRNFSVIQFTDNDARIIKSKLGFRMNLGRGGVGFLAGLLVMLGLLGTFLGLLKTIDAVGVAMGSMSNLGADGGMESFIESISAPLQGMGLAFSSSLFGLSGSLLSGFFNYLSNGAQNRFIEDAGRWIDNRIPKFDASKVPDKEVKKAPSKDDMQSWLLGYVYLANKTNKRLGSLFGALSDLTDQTKKASEKTDQVVAVGQGSNEILGKIATDLGGRQETMKNMEGLVGQVGRNIQDMTQVNIESKSLLSQIDTRFESFQTDTSKEKAQLKELLGQIQMMRKVGIKFGTIQKTLTDELGVLAVAMKDQSGDRHAVLNALNGIQKTLEKTAHEQKKESALSKKKGSSL